MWGTVSFWHIAETWLCYPSASTGLLGSLFWFWNAKVWLPHQIWMWPVLVWLRSQGKIKAFVGTPSLFLSHIHNKRTLFQATWAPGLYSQKFIDVIYKTKTVALNSFRLKIYFFFLNWQAHKYCKKDIISTLALGPL